MRHKVKSQKFYLDLWISLEWHYLNVRWILAQTIIDTILWWNLQVSFPLSYLWLYLTRRWFLFTLIASSKDDFMLQTFYAPFGANL